MPFFARLQAWREARRRRRRLRDSANNATQPVATTTNRNSTWTPDQWYHYTQEGLLDYHSQQAQAPLDVERVLVHDIDHISDCAFWALGALRNVRIAKSVKRIGRDAFHDCSRLKSVEIVTAGVDDYSDQDQLTLISYFAFYRCRALERMTLPASLKVLEACAFYDCNNLTQIKFEGSRSNDTSVRPPSQLKFVGSSAFSGCQKLQQIDFSHCHELRVIEFATFNRCDGLRTVWFPPYLEEIWDSAFNKCRSLDKLVFPKTLKTIGQAAFYGCRSLTTIFFTSMDVLTADLLRLSLYRGPFEECHNLCKVILPKGIPRVLWPKLLFRLFLEKKIFSAPSQTGDNARRRGLVSCCIPNQTIVNARSFQSENNSPAQRASFVFSFLSSRFDELIGADKDE